MITENALRRLKNALISAMDHPEYDANGQTIRADISQASVRSDGQVDVAFVIDAQAANGSVISGLRIMDAMGNELIRKDDQIAGNVVFDGFVYRISVTIVEG